MVARQIQTRQQRTKGMVLPDDVTQIGWRLYSVERRDRDNPADRWLAIAEPPEGWQVPWVRDRGQTREDAVNRLAIRIRLYWRTEPEYSRRARGVA